MNAIKPLAAKGFLRALYLHPLHGITPVFNFKKEVIRLDYIGEQILPKTMNYTFGNEEASIKLWSEESPHGWIHHHSIILSKRSVTLLDFYADSPWLQEKYVAIGEDASGKCLLLGYPSGLQVKQCETAQQSELTLQYFGEHPALEVNKSAFKLSNATILNQYINRSWHEPNLMLESIRNIPLTSFAQ
jgi:hypothetical protein